MAESEIAIEFHATARLVVLRLRGNVSAETYVAAVKRLWTQRPETREWDSVIDLTRYDGQVGWPGMHGVAGLDLPPPAAGTPRVAIVSDSPATDFVARLGRTLHPGREVRWLRRQQDAENWFRAPPDDPPGDPTGNPP